MLMPRFSKGRLFVRCVFEMEVSTDQPPAATAAWWERSGVIEKIIGTLSCSFWLPAVSIVLIGIVDDSSRDRPSGPHCVHTSPSKGGYDGE